MDLCELNTIISSQHDNNTENIIKNEYMNHCKSSTKSMALVS
jgi:hypothetical protein